MANILLIEDYASLQKIYSETLKAAKHTVYVASDGGEGLELTKQKKVDLILLDLLLPQTGGLDFLKAYETKKHPETQVIVLTNIFSTDLLNEALQLGASQYLIKADLTPKRLAQIVDDALAEPKKT
jgi:DNA-binding NtrC family response regulator